MPLLVQMPPDRNPPLSDVRLAGKRLALDQPAMASHGDERRPVELHRLQVTGFDKLVKPGLANADQILRSRIGNAHSLE